MLEALFWIFKVDLLTVSKKKHEWHHVFCPYILVPLTLKLMIPESCFYLCVLLDWVATFLTIGKHLLKAFVGVGDLVQW